MAGLHPAGCGGQLAADRKRDFLRCRAQLFDHLCLPQRRIAGLDVRNCQCAQRLSARVQDGKLMFSTPLTR